MLACLFLLTAMSMAHAQGATAPAAAAREYRVLLVGNSLTYTNNLPALLRAVGASQGVAITTETYAAPGGTLAERWHDGHVAKALRDRKFDVLVLQEQGGKLAACVANAVEQRKAPCAASMHAYREFSALARQGGANVLLFATWAADDRWQGRLNRSVGMLAEKSSARVFRAATAIESMREAQPGSNPYPDGSHPSTQASLMLAVALYRDITGTAPVARDLLVTAPLLPVNAAVSPASPMESQPALAGDRKTTVIPASLIAPLVKALPDPATLAKMDPARGRR